MTRSSTAAARYEELAVDRELYLQLANDCAKYTIPSLFQYPRPAKAKSIPTPYQSVGARGVNNLAAKLMLSLLPPNTPCFRYVIDRLVLDKEQPDPEFLSNLEKALSKYERAIMAEIESSSDRPVCHEAFKHLIVVGNVLLYDGPAGLKVFHLDRYVVKRDPDGNPVEIIAKESVAPAALPAEFLAKLQTKSQDEVPKGKGRKSASATLDIYTHLVREADEWVIYQECEGEEVPDSRGTYPIDACPWIAMRFIRKDGEDYGHSYVEEYLGDLISLDGLSQALLDGAMAAAKVIGLVNPNGLTSLKVVGKARNLDMVAGREEDVKFLQVQKFNDFRVAQQQMQTIEERLAYAFLLNTAVQRQAERVTAEEIRFAAGELEASLGGVYSLMTVEFLLRYIKQKITKLEKAGKLPALPKEIVKPVVVVGIEALGRGTDRAKLVSYLQLLAQLTGPEKLGGVVNLQEAAKRLATADGIDTEGLVLTPEDQAAAAQQGQQAALLDRLGPQAITQLGNVMTKGIAPGMPGGPPLDAQPIEPQAQPQEG